MLSTLCISPDSQGAQLPQVPGRLEQTVQTPKLGPCWWLGRIPDSLIPAHRRAADPGLGLVTGNIEAAAELQALRESEGPSFQLQTSSRSSIVPAPAGGEAGHGSPMSFPHPPASLATST